MPLLCQLMKDLSNISVAGDNWNVCYTWNGDSRGLVSLRDSMYLVSERLTTIGTLDCLAWSLATRQWR